VAPLTNLPYCGKVVSTKVGCGRFNGKRSRVAPAFLEKGRFKCRRQYLISVTAKHSQGGIADTRRWWSITTLLANTRKSAMPHDRRGGLKIISAPSAAVYSQLQQWR
jgi:hypothetical protein